MTRDAVERNDTRFGNGAKRSPRHRRAFRRLGILDDRVATAIGNPLEA
jgi:hypothetical protein